MSNAADSESLVEEIAARIVVIHEELNRVSATRPDPGFVDELVREIWRLAREFDCALYVDQELRRIGSQARGRCASTGWPPTRR